MKYNSGIEDGIGRTEKDGQMVGAFEDALEHLLVDAFDVLAGFHVLRIGEPVEGFLFIHQITCFGDMRNSCEMWPRSSAARRAKPSKWMILPCRKNTSAGVERCPNFLAIRWSSHLTRSDPYSETSSSMSSKRRSTRSLSSSPTVSDQPQSKQTNNPNRIIISFHSSQKWSGDQRQAPH